MDIKSGSFLIKTARKAISTYLTNNEVIDPPISSVVELFEELGVFVTLKKYPDKDLRGCIGYPEPIMPLVNAVIHASISSATQDPRFHPLTIDELSKITLEITILTKPEIILGGTPEDRMKQIELGRHGLIIERNSNKGLLLPQVPIEHRMSKIEFLESLCRKAGLHGGAWKDPKSSIYSFEGQIFSEESPNGRIFLIS